MQQQNIGGEPGGRSVRTPTEAGEDVARSHLPALSTERIIPVDRAVEPERVTRGKTTRSEVKSLGVPASQTREIGTIPAWKVVANEANDTRASEPVRKGPV
jgi:hypothetical protein